MGLVSRKASQSAKQVLPNRLPPTTRAGLCEFSKSIEAANFAQLWSQDYHDGTLLRSQAVTNFLRPSGSQDVSFPGNWWKTFYSLKQRLLPSASAHRLIVMFSAPISLRRTPVSLTVLPRVRHESTAAVLHVGLRGHFAMASRGAKARSLA